MRKVICDGCDGEIGEEDESAGDTVVVLIVRGPISKKDEGQEYDLCAGCETSLRQQADPKNWARIV